MRRQHRLAIATVATAAAATYAILVSTTGLAAAPRTGSVRAAASVQRHRKRPATLTCATRQGGTVFRMSTVRLFTLGPTPGEYQSEVTTRLMACLKPKGRVFRVGFLSQAGDSNVGVLESPRAAAPYAAFAIQASDETAAKYGQPSTSYITVKSVNLSNGKTIASASFVQQPAQQSTTTAAVPNLQISGAGSIAWLLSSNSGETLYAYDSAGQSILDTGSIDPKSLAVNGSTVTWTNAGIQHSATLQ
jgi:hypothetical protein